MKEYSDKIIEFFKLLNESSIQYVLLRNINDELPHKFDGSKDIDILIHQDNKNEFYKFMKDNSWKKKLHPLEAAGNFNFLYAMDKFDFFTKTGINLDICYQLACRSTNADEWMPLDQLIYDSIWSNRKKNSEYPWYEMCREDEIVHLLARCIFDKKKFLEGYINRISELFNLADKNEIIKRLDKVVFKFTPILMELLNNCQYDKIIREYLEYTDY